MTSWFADSRCPSESRAQHCSGWGHICLVAHNMSELSVGDISVAPASTARNLGVLFDRNLKFDAQIIKTCCTGYYYLQSECLTLNSTRCLVHALVMGRVDYCNSLLYGLLRNNINKLRRLQNMAARLIINTPPVLRQLHWLLISFRIKLKAILITFKAIHAWTGSILYTKFN